MTRALLLAAVAGLGACEARPVDPEEAARACEARARAAQAPTGEVSVGTSSHDGPFLGLGLGISTDFLRGRDPYEVYESCVLERTGAPPIRPPALLR